MYFVSHHLLKCAVVHKDDAIIAEILTLESNLIAQLERAHQVVLKAYKKRYERRLLRRLRLVHPVLAWFNNEDCWMIMERLILFAEELHPTNFSQFSIAVGL